MLAWNVAIYPLASLELTSYEKLSRGRALVSFTHLKASCSLVKLADVAEAVVLQGSGYPLAFVVPARMLPSLQEVITEGSVAFSVTFGEEKLPPFSSDALVLVEAWDQS